MSDIQSLANQLSWCMTTKNYLNELNSEIQHVTNQYAENIEMLEQNYISELLPEMRRMLQEFEESTDGLIRHIEDEHLEYIDKQSRQIQGSLERFL